MGNTRVVVLTAGLMVASVACVGRTGRGQGTSTTASDASVEYAAVQADAFPTPTSAPVPVPIPVSARVPDAGARPGSDLRTAAEIRPVVRHYLKTSRAVALRSLPSDWGHALPKDAGEASARRR